MEKLTDAIKEELGANHIMLSYNWASSKQLTEKVYSSLKQYGLPLWMDTAGGVHGSVSGSMAEAVENASIIIPFMTEKYQESKACNQEIEYANDLGVEIVPIKAQKTTADGKKYRPRGKLGILTAGKLYIDFTDSDTYEDNLRQLITSLGTSIIDPERVMKLLEEGQGGKEEQEGDASAFDSRIPITVITKDLDIASHNFGYTETTFEGPVLSVSLIKQLSKSACTLNESFGSVGCRVWADNGARGTFRVVYTTSRRIKVMSPITNDTNTITIKLQSIKFAYKERVMDRDVKGMELVKQLSKTACSQGVSFGFEGSKVWVDKGARGIFKITYE